jgi:hypothetical protein
MAERYRTATMSSRRSVTAASAAAVVRRRAGLVDAFDVVEIELGQEADVVADLFAADGQVAHVAPALSIRSSSTLRSHPPNIGSQ